MKASLYVNKYWPSGLHQLVYYIGLRYGQYFDAETGKHLPLNEINVDDYIPVVKISSNDNYPSSPFFIKTSAIAALASAPPTAGTVIGRAEEWAVATSIDGNIIIKTWSSPNVMNQLISSIKQFRLPELNVSDVNTFHQRFLPSDVYFQDELRHLQLLQRPLSAFPGNIIYDVDIGLYPPAPLSIEPLQLLRDYIESHLISYEEAVNMILKGKLSKFEIEPDIQLFVKPPDQLATFATNDRVYYAFSTHDNLINRIYPPINYPIRLLTLEEILQPAPKRRNSLQRFSDKVMQLRNGYF